VVAAKNKKEFIIVWGSHIDQLGELAYSLPSSRTKELFASLKEFKLFVKEAADHTFVDCGQFRLNPRGYQCKKGPCEKGDTAKTRAFGNCCMKCPKVMKCYEGCSKTEDLKGNIEEVGKGANRLGNK